LRKLAWGAESDLYVSTYLGWPVVVKKRFEKPYMDKRLSSKLVRQRTATEAKILFEASRAGVRVPLPLYVDPEAGIIAMEYVDGTLLRDEIERRQLEWVLAKACELGEMLGKLHNVDIVHGDPTTSNVLVERGTEELCLIDFGLAYFSKRPEDKAVDLRVLERAVMSTHPLLKDEVLRSLFECYARVLKDGGEVLESFKKISLMGRYVKERKAVRA